jgi:transposase-like protein
MFSVCREFGISRKTGYKISDRHKGHGLEALTDRSRRPVRHERMHLTLKKEATRPPEMNSSQQQARFDASSKPTRCMTAISSSPPAAASACTARK